MSSSLLLPNGYAACHAVIADAINRCRHMSHLSRVTIVIKHLENNPPSMLCSFELSVSDTGPGICHEEVLKLFHRFASAPLTHLCDTPLFWGGELLLLTSEFMESEVRQYHVRDAFNQAEILQLRSVSKESGTYSGSSIVFNLKGYPGEFLLFVIDICCKIKLLMLKTVVVEVCVARLTLEGNIYEEVLLLCEGLALPSELTNLDRLNVGVANYVSENMHAKRVSPTIGKAMARSSESLTEKLWFFEACFAVVEAMEAGDTSVCPKNIQTKVFFFQDFMCTAITPLIVQTLKTKVNWERFGLYIKDIQLSDIGTAIIEWEGPSRLETIELVLHKYRNRQTKAVSWSREMSICKKCVEDALSNLKHQSPHLFISHRSTELQKYVPDLSSCISKLISSSSDVSFKASCVKILGLASTDFDDVNACISGRIMQAIEILDTTTAKVNEMRDKDVSINSTGHGAEEFPFHEEEEEGDDYDSSEGNRSCEFL